MFTEWCQRSISLCLIPDSRTRRSTYPQKKNCFTSKERGHPSMWYIYIYGIHPHIQSWKKKSLLTWRKEMKFSKKGALKNPPAVFIPAGLFAVEGNIGVSRHDLNNRWGDPTLVVSHVKRAFLIFFQGFEILALWRRSERAKSQIQFLFSRLNTIYIEQRESRLLYNPFVREKTMDWLIDFLRIFFFISCVILEADYDWWCVISRRNWVQ